MACVPRQDCTHVEQLFSIRENVTSTKKERDQATKVLRHLVCDRKKKLLCCDREHYRQTLTHNGK